MGARRSQDKDGVDVGLFDHLIVVQELLLRPEEPCARCCACLIEIADGDQPNAIHAHQVGQVICGGHHAAPHDADFDFVSFSSHTASPRLDRPC